MIASLEWKPAKPTTCGMPIPASDKLPITMSQWVMGMRDLRPPILRMSCSSETAWITEPAPRKRSALKKAWVAKWKIAAP